MYEPRLDRVIRWNTLLIHVNINVPAIVSFVFGDRIGVDSLDYDWARNKIMENQRSYKSKVLSGFKSLIGTMVTQDPALLDIPKATFSEKLCASFNEHNYFHCFPYMKNYLGIDNSTETGKWFLKTIYTNVGTRVWSWKVGGETADEWYVIESAHPTLLSLPCH